MKIILFIIGMVSARYHHFSEESDLSLRPKGDMTKCLTLTKKRKIEFKDCDNVVGLKQKWVVEMGNFFGRRYKSLHYLNNPNRGANYEMCVTLNKAGQARRVVRCRNEGSKVQRGGYPRQLFDMLGDEDQLSFPRDDGSKRDCLGVDPATGVMALGDCDAESCNVGRDANFKCSSCGWRYGYQDKCDYCDNSSHVLTDDGDCIDINSVNTCTEKYPLGHTMKHLKWYHLQGQNFCTRCDSNDPSNCLENACPQHYNTGEWYDGKCRCPANSAAAYSQSGGPFVAYAACASDQPGNKWADQEAGQNWNCLDNSFQTAPESKCKSCQWYVAFYCSGCKTKGAVINYSNPGSRMYCKCPEGFVYRANGDKCVRA